MILESGAWAGFTVYPNTKLSPERAANMIMQFGVDRMMVNSSADWGPSTAMSVPLTIVELRKRGLPAAKIQQLVWDNPFRFYDQTGRLSKILKSLSELARGGGSAVPGGHRALRRRPVLRGPRGLGGPVADARRETIGSSCRR